jgi:hypothetical protein
VLGRRIVGEPRSLLVAFVVGWGILRLVDLVPGIGNLASTAATVYGLGAVAVAAWRSTRVTRGGPARAPVAA